ncbi:MAG: hypothetical protein NT084_10505 [Bacteroidetes bacterium]|nr:hypothetical protein [Bacteroidota bacterium]
MKNLIAIALLLFTIKMNAQDIIKLKNGSEIKGAVIEITSDQVKFKKTQEGPIYTMAKTDIEMITYQNGKQETFTEAKAPATAATTATSTTTAKEDDALEPVKRYGGPRLGFTVLGPGTSNDKMDNLFNRRVNPVITQFGWQFETRIFTLKDGSSGLVEFVPMIGGLEQGLFLPSATGLIGFRTKSGIELGMGPSISLGGASVVFAAGASFKAGKVTFPVNLVFLPSITKTTLPSTNYVYDPATNTSIMTTIPGVTSHSGYRVSLVIGFNSRKD